MNLEIYKYCDNDSKFDYEFESVGPKGAIKKVVRLSPIGINIYNLGFGDLDEKTGAISDFSVSNNADTEKILATVAHIAHNFTEIYLSTAIFIKGTAPARTRLYQMKISEHWNTIKTLFEVHGLRKEQWELFQKGINYNAFLARHQEASIY